MYISLSLYIYIYTYIHAYIHTYTHAYMHAYIHTYVYPEAYNNIQKQRKEGGPFDAAADEPEGAQEPEPKVVGQGKNGVSTNGVAAIVYVFDRGTFWGTPVNLLLSSQKCQGVPFSPNLSKLMYYFCSGTLSIDPICHLSATKVSTAVAMAAQHALQAVVKANIIMIMIIITMIIMIILIYMYIYIYIHIHIHINNNNQPKFINIKINKTQQRNNTSIASSINQSINKTKCTPGAGLRRPRGHRRAPGPPERRGGRGGQTNDNENTNKNNDHNKDNHNDNDNNNHTMSNNY